MDLFAEVEDVVGDRDYVIHQRIRRYGGHRSVVWAVSVDLDGLGFDSTGEYENPVEVRDELREMIMVDDASREVDAAEARMEDREPDYNAPNQAERDEGMARIYHESK